MNINKERLLIGNQQNKIFEEKIKEKGIKTFIREFKNIRKKHSIEIIQKSYNDFKKDLKCYPHSLSKHKKNEKSNSIIKTINYHKNNIIIFEVEDDDLDYKIKFPLLPFDKFYIASDIITEIDGELYSISGFFVLNVGSELQVFYNWSRIISNGWAFNMISLDKNCLDKEPDSLKYAYGDKKINLIAQKKFVHLIKKLIYKLNKKEYPSYKKYSHGECIEKQMVYVGNVRSHKRHFWDSTGYFNIPNLSNEELLNKGYQIDEVVYCDGELKMNIPYRIIGDYIIGEEKKTKENKVYDLIERRIFRQEEKVLSILREILPDNYIRRHDRKTLNGLELDFNIPELRLGIEYDGEQHFDRKLCEDVFHSDFNALQKRDRTKDKLCRKKNITLIRIKYDEPLTKTHIKNKLKEKNKLC